MFYILICIAVSLIYLQLNTEWYFSIKQSTMVVYVLLLDGLIKAKVIIRMGAVKSLTHAYTWNEYLYWYIQKKDIPNIQAVLQKKPELIGQPLTVNYKTTPLHRASVKGYLEVVQLLVQKYKADVDLPNELGETPLMGAAKRGHIQVVRYLLSMNASTDFISGCDLKAIDYPILAGFYDISLMIYERMKEKQLKTADQYRDLGKMYLYRYVNYEMVLQGLNARIQPENVGDYLTKVKPVYDDPVVDPRQTWKEWFCRNLQFKDPPICERSQLPQQLQPQNQKFGRLRHFFARLTNTHRVPKTEFEPSNRTEHHESTNQLQMREAFSENMANHEARSIE